MVMVIALLAAAQLRWLGELGSASRLRLERDLRVAVQNVASELALATTRLTTELDRATGDSIARDAAWAAWRESVPDLSALYREGSTRPAVDPQFAADSLLPRLARRIAELAEIEVGFVLARREPSGTELVVARQGVVGDGRADIEVRLPLVGWRQRAMFRVGDSDSSSAALARPADSFDWSGRADSVPLALPALDQEWILRAWVEPGSLERSVERVGRRNLLLGSVLILVLATTGALTLGSLRRHQRLAADRATVLAGIAHEVRTPIAVIRAAADNLVSGVVTAPERIREYGTLVEREIDRLENDVEAALAFAAAGEAAGAVADPAELVDVVREVREACEAPERVAIEASSAVECGIDRRAALIAVRNLVANALAYSPVEQPVVVQVAVRGNQAEVAVLDRGPGVAPADRSRLLDPFVRGTAGSASGRPGLGLGLALVQRIADRSGGRLTVLDREGGGAIFRLRLPLR